MRSIHRYLASLLNSRPRRVLVAGAAVPALLLALAACGSAASASPAAGSSASPAAGSSSSPGSGSAYFNCLREHGVTGGYGGRSSSGSSSSGSSAAINSARQACASLRPSGGFGGSVGFSAAFQKFESCLSAHGVTLPSGSSSGEGFRGLFADLQSGSPADKAAFNACKSDLPFTPGGSTSGGSTST